MYPGLVQETCENRLGLLANGEDLAKAILRRGELSLFGLLGFPDLGECGFDVGCGRLGFDGFLERVFFSRRFAKPSRPPATTAIATPGRVAAAAATGGAEHVTAKSGSHFPAGFTHLRDQGLDGLPFGIVGDLQPFPIHFHHAFLHLGRVESAALTASSTTGSASLLATTAAAAAAGRLLGERTGRHGNETCDGRGEEGETGESLHENGGMG